LTNIDVEDRFSETPVENSEEVTVTITVGLPDQFPEADGHDPYEGCSTWARIMCGRVARSAAPVRTAREMEARRMETVTPSNLIALGIRLD
jgi:hypothetical protein